MIRRVWRKKDGGGKAWEMVKTNLEKSKKKLLVWRKINKGPSEDTINQKVGELQKLYEAEGQLDVGSIKSLQVEVDEIMEWDELKWKQLAKEHWLKLGDKNSRYFHACVKQRQKASKIECISDGEGRWQSSPEAIQTAFIEHFQQPFTSS